VREGEAMHNVTPGGRRKEEGEKPAKAGNRPIADCGQWPGWHCERPAKSQGRAEDAPLERGLENGNLSEVHRDVIKTVGIERLRRQEPRNEKFGQKAL